MEMRAGLIKQHLLQLQKTDWMLWPEPGLKLSHFPSLLVNFLLDKSVHFWKNIGCQMPTLDEAILIARTFQELWRNVPKDVRAKKREMAWIRRYCRSREGGIDASRRNVYDITRNRRVYPMGYTMRGRKA